MKKNVKISSLSSRRIEQYIAVMLLGVVLVTFITKTITIAWVINLLGLLILFFPFYSQTNTRCLIGATLYIFCGLITLFFNMDFISSDLKSIGTNVNILVLPITFMIINTIKTKYPIKYFDVEKCMIFLSRLGTLAVILSWILGGVGILSVYNGANAYQAEVAGFFYSKNIYGAFVGLTLSADLFLNFASGSLLKKIIIAVKTLAVILSFSRAALLQIGVMFFVYFWKKKSKSMADYILALVGILCGVISFYYLQNDEGISNFFMNSIFRIDAGDAGRSLARHEALDKFTSNLINPLFGVGFAGIDALDIDIDNTYLYLWFTGGIPKVLFYIGALIISYIKIKSLKLYNPEIYRLCISVYVSYMFYAFFESVAVLELGLLNFLFTFFMFILPIGLYKDRKFGFRVDVR